ncbi:MAG: hypothetical protein WC304_01715 [Candidatus Gracilibacteria bacterium]|jgi:hypothetical protein
MQKKTLAVAASSLLLITLLGGCYQTKDNDNGRERMNNGNFQGERMQDGSGNGGRGAMKCKENDTACAAMQQRILNGEAPTPPKTTTPAVDSTANSTTTTPAASTEATTTTTAE